MFSLKPAPRLRRVQVCVDTIRPSILIKSGARPRRYNCEKENARVRQHGLKSEIAPKYIRELLNLAIGSKGNAVVNLSEVSLPSAKLSSLARYQCFQPMRSQAGVCKMHVCPYLKNVPLVAVLRVVLQVGQLHQEWHALEAADRRDHYLLRLGLGPQHFRQGMCMSM